MRPDIKTSVVQGDPQVKKIFCHREIEAANLSLLGQVSKWRHDDPVCGAELRSYIALGDGAEPRVGKGNRHNDEAGLFVAERMKQLKPSVHILMLSAYVDLPRETSNSKGQQIKLFAS